MCEGGEGGEGEGGGGEGGYVMFYCSFHACVSSEAERRVELSAVREAMHMAKEK